MKPSTDVTVPLFGVTTTTEAAPEACEGVMAVKDVALLTVKLAAAVPPKVTLVAPVNPVPTILTSVPPTIDPDDAVTEVIVALGNVAGKTAVITPELALFVTVVTPAIVNMFALTPSS